MWKIITLDKTLANQISAWEVVERPFSVVKELVENSIDAWCKNIKVEISSWWIDEIVVSDDWEWISEDDLRIITNKYTTSKIKSLEDLYNVMTFWFRWEALASISSVSNFSIISRFVDSDFWNILSFGENSELEIKPYPCEVWTKIIVKNLFYNTPARLNYLKKEKTEYSHILDFLNQVVLIYPNIWFEFISDKKQIFKYKGDETLQTRIWNVYGEEFFQNLLPLDFAMNWIKIEWFISNPKVNFPNRNRQSLFVNKRVIKSPIIYKAINDAYNRYIPHNTFPAYVLNILVNPTEVDVNVHPRKMEVRFAEESSIFRAVYNACESKLNNVSLISNSEITPTSSFPRRVEEEKFYTGSWTKFKSYSPYKDTNSNPAQYKINDVLNFSAKILENSTIHSVWENNKFIWKNEQDISTITDLHITPLWKIIWQMHNSYILLETNYWLKILDQHALAERIIYEKLVNAEKKFSTQWLLIWENINLTSKEINILETNIQTFYEMWFDFEILSSGMVIINWVPDFVKKENIKNLFLGIISDIWEFWNKKSISLEETKNKVFAYTACRSAIKFWDKLSLFEMNKLINDSILDYSSTCPHWRPVVYEISLNELKGKYER